jgi:hypothetical protein
LLGFGGGTFASFSLLLLLGLFQCGFALRFLLWSISLKVRIKPGNLLQQQTISDSYSL